ncbi:MAG: hypothetical protein AAF307_06030, partial [Pseudomonadota bacterium]
ILTTLIAATLAGGAIAGTSDRYKDQRFDTAVGHVTDAKAADAAQAPTVVLSTNNGNGSGTAYPYINPYGVGPNNDSR